MIHYPRYFRFVIVALLLGPTPSYGAVGFQEIDDVELFAGAPLHIGVDGFDTDGQELTFELWVEDVIEQRKSVYDQQTYIRVDE